MKVRAVFAVLVVLVLLCIEGFSATLVGAGVRDAAETGTIRKWSIGVGAQLLERDLDVSGRDGSTKHEARVLDFLVGYDAMDWLTVFGTLGGVQVKTFEADGYGDSNVKASVGLNGNVWKTEILDPEFMTGVLTMKTVMEASMYRVDDEDEELSGYWLDFSVAVPFCYEIFAERQDNAEQVPYSLAILAGPVVSGVYGRIKDDSGSTRSLRGGKTLGVLGGVDIYFSHNLSVGCQIEYVDYASIAGSLTYHF